MGASGYTAMHRTAQSVLDSTANESIHNMYSILVAINCKIRTLLSIYLETKQKRQQKQTKTITTNKETKNPVTSCGDGLRR